MFVFGHLGIGSKIVSPWTKGLPKRGVFLGTLLPDLIDKPLYYGLVAITGRHGAELGLIDGTRCFGHTGLFLMAVTLASFFRRSHFLAAVALGIASHLVLDNLSDALRQDEARSAMIALLWPLGGLDFVSLPYGSFAQHLGSVWNRITIGGELLGVAFLGWDGWKVAHEREILSLLKKKGGLRDALRGGLKPKKRKGRAHLRRVQ